MKRRFVFFFLLGALAVSFPSFAESSPIRACPFSRGVNLSEWFQVSGPRAIDPSRFTDADFRDIRALGVDVVRLPINLHAMSSGAADYRLDPLFLELLDSAVDKAERAGLHIILDDHTFDPGIPTDPGIGAALLKIWPQMAARYRARSDLVSYEILNEPHAIDSALWGKIQGEVIAAIRAVDSRHAIVVGGVDYNSVESLMTLPAYADDNLIYTFHFYDPMVFTHQGAGFTSPSMKSLTGVPWPPESGSVPRAPKSLSGTWIAHNLENYRDVGSADRMFARLDLAAKFARQRNVRVFCGEFGVLKTFAPADSRVRWYRAVRDHLETTGIAWATWDYYGSFGLFVPDSPAFIDRDLNVRLAEALGFAVPAQKAGAREPARETLSLYDDSISPLCFRGGQRGDTVDFRCADGASGGGFCIRWTDIRLYDSVSLSFRGGADLSTLAAKGYALSFMIRVSGGEALFHARFMNPDGPASIPWRMTKVVEARLAPADGAWHRVVVPLSSMADSGGWKQSEEKWYGPRGAFSWKDVTGLQFAIEDRALAGTTIDLDDIKIEPAQ